MLLKIAVVILALLPLIPLWHYEYLPLQDYPNHMARLEILASYGDSGFYRDNFEAGLRDKIPPPNLALDIFVAALRPLFAVDASMRLFISLYVILYIAALYLLSRALKRDFVMLLLFNLPIIYSSHFFDGALNFLMGMPLFLLSVFALEKYPIWRWKSLALAALLSVLIYISHLFAFFAFAVFVTAWLLIERPGNRAVAFAVLLLAPLSAAGAAFAFYNVPIDGEPFSVKVKLLHAGFVFMHLPYAGFFAVVVLYIFSIYSVLRGGASVRKVYATAACVLWASFLLLPHGTQAINVRAVPFALMLLPFSLDSKTRAIPAKAALTIIYAIVMAWMFAGFSAFNKDYSTRCVKEIRDASTVLPIDVTTPKGLITPYAHAWGYFLKEKDMRVPYLFTGHLLRARNQLPAPEMRWKLNGDFSGKVEYEPSIGESLGVIRGSYDYVLLSGRDAEVEGLLGSVSQKVCSAGNLSLYKMLRQD